jgi:hypothetical protein
MVDKKICTPDEQALLAQYCRWARQNLDAVLDVVNEDLTHY